MRYILTEEEYKELKEKQYNKLRVCNYYGTNEPYLINGDTDIQVRPNEFKIFFKGNLIYETYLKEGETSQISIRQK